MLLAPFQTFTLDTCKVRGEKFLCTKCSRAFSFLKRNQKNITIAGVSLAGGFFIIWLLQRGFLFERLGVLSAGLATKTVGITGETDLQPILEEAEKLEEIAFYFKEDVQSGVSLEVGTMGQQQEICGNIAGSIANIEKIGRLFPEKGEQVRGILYYLEESLKLVGIAFRKLSLEKGYLWEYAGEEEEKKEEEENFFL